MAFSSSPCASAQLSLCPQPHTNQPPLWLQPQTLLSRPQPPDHPWLSHTPTHVAIQPLHLHRPGVPTPVTQQMDFTCAAEVTLACLLLSVGMVGILGSFQLDLQTFHANLEAIHGLDGSLCTGRVVEAYKT